jgi:nitroreductase
MTIQTESPTSAKQSVFEALTVRRAIKGYDPNHRLQDDEVRTLLTAAALSPTAFNIQNRHVIVVRNPNLKERLSSAAYGQRQVADAAAVFVLTADHEAHRRTDRYLRNAPPATRDALAAMIASTFEGKPDALHEEGVRSTAMMAMSLMLAATELGLDSGPMTGFDRAQVSQLLALDEAHPPLLLVVIGRGNRSAHPRLGMLDFEEFVSFDRFGNVGLRGSLDLE